VPQIGSFRCLNGKVDLSTHEAEHTVDTWQVKLQKLRQELVVRTIAKNITSHPAPYTVKVLAYQNSTRRNNAPQLIIGSSIAGVCCVVFGRVVIVVVALLLLLRTVAAAAAAAVVVSLVVVVVVAK